MNKGIMLVVLVSLMTISVQVSGYQMMRSLVISRSKAVTLSDLKAAIRSMYSKKNSLKKEIPNEVKASHHDNRPSYTRIISPVTGYLNGQRARISKRGGRLHNVRGFLAQFCDKVRKNRRTISKNTLTMYRLKCEDDIPSWWSVIPHRFY
jgi:hypothetical protein